MKLDVGGTRTGVAVSGFCKIVLQQVEANATLNRGPLVPPSVSIAKN